MFVCKGPLAVRPTHILLVFFIIGVFLFGAQRGVVTPPSSPLLKDAEVNEDGSASAEELYLARLGRELGLSQQAIWRAWRIVPSEQSDEWPSVTQVRLNFESVSSKTIDINAPDRMDLYAKKRMQLPVPVSPMLDQVDASDFLFGISTTVARIADRDYAMVKAWSRWLTDGHHHANGASLVVVLDQARPDELEEIDNVLQATGIDCWVTSTDEPMSMARRYVELTRILRTFAANMEMNGQEKRWFGLVEDEVFFPSLANLRDRLFAYNTDSPVYIGVPSERPDWSEGGKATTTFGGGVVIFSRSAVSVTASLPCFESGQTMSFTSKRWDELLQTCILKNTDMNMHVLPGFFSPNDEAAVADTQSDSYEMGLQPLLLRRYGERHLLDVNKAHLVTNVCGEACFMQRYLFRDNWVLVNGVSLNHYPDGVEVHILSENRYDEDDDGAHGKDVDRETPTSHKKSSSPSTPQTPDRIVIDDNIAEIDRAQIIWTGRRDSWRLMDSATTKDGSVWQAYVRKAGRGSEDNKDSVIVLIWEIPKPAAS
ncbi:hypothetical protein GMORB2_0404 [Geosmithia morbida]|uniref:Glycosyltransferase family 31 protein n=1 Tax=Geosmithia morbida TaxID=1094350 RepID=A0A9P4Z0X0_9HYPO|nr:uncharacterized protein GMORB2_0404 [Geosmithia morbida]KAF4126668.1 hypothetical protein GMORB2_0404 [Geosmithia morbida]